jgi:hypothetical protein
MKTTFKILAVLVAMVGFSAASYAQSATATASATIITPLTISRVDHMNFGNVAVSATQGGTLQLAPNGTRTPTGGVSVSTANSGSPTAASFNLAGNTNYSYSITLPGNSDVTVINGANSMTVTNFTSTPSGTGQLTAGSGSIQVGATLNVGAGQATGTYTSSNFTVTVAYN